MTFLGHILSLVFIPVFAVTGFFFGEHKAVPSSVAPAVQVVSTSQATTSTKVAPVSQSQNQPAKINSSGVNQAQAQQQAAAQAQADALAQQQAVARAQAAANSQAQAAAELATQQAQAQQQAAAQVLAQQEAAVQAQAAAQERINQANTLTAEYNQQINALNQQILDIKTKYYKEVAGVSSTGTTAVAQGNAQALLNTANSQIQQIQLQEQQLQITYQTQLNALQ